MMKTMKLTSPPCLAMLAALTLAAAAGPNRAAAQQTDPDIETRTLVYKVGDDPFEGYLARPVRPASDTLPGVLVVHDWTGNGAFARARADQLAKLGYVAFALDMYGQGHRAKNPEEAGKLASPFYQNFALFRERGLPALAELAKQPGVDPKRLGAIGFCFGGTTVLELARAGADLKGVVTFHGGLKTPNGADDKNIKGQLLILHGAIDPLVPPADVAATMTDLNAAKVPYKFIAYPLAVHSFTNPEAGNDNTKPAAYNPAAAEDAYAQMRRFFGEIFAGAPRPPGRRAAAVRPGSPERFSLCTRLTSNGPSTVFSDHWNPRVAGTINDAQLKLVKLRGEFVWHHHEHEDELFLVHRGSLLMRFRDWADVRLHAGEFLVVPHGVEHLPVAEEECELILLEPATTLNTGNVVNERTVHAPAALPS